MFLADELGLDDFAFFAWGAHLHSESRREADELSTPLPALSLRGLYWRAYRAMLDLGARWNEGLKIGKATGYDSGSTLDYVYRNSPQGSNALGIMADKHYLNAVGWRGIRQRKTNIGKAVQTASALLRGVGKPVHVLDIASGHGRSMCSTPSPLTPCPTRCACATTACSMSKQAAALSPNAACKTLSASISLTRSTAPSPATKTAAPTG